VFSFPPHCQLIPLLQVDLRCSQTSPFCFLFFSFSRVPTCAQRIGTLFLTLWTLKFEGLFFLPKTSFLTCSWIHSSLSLSPHQNCSILLVHLFAALPSLTCDFDFRSSRQEPILINGASLLPFFVHAPTTIRKPFGFWFPPLFSLTKVTSTKSVYRFPCAEFYILPSLPPLSLISLFSRRGTCSLTSILASSMTEE